MLAVFCALEIQAISKEARGFLAEERYLPHERKNMDDSVTVSDIEPWMTFYYINTVFKLPPSYLKDSFDITDLKYPNISLVKYARDHRLARFDFVSQVQKVVSIYRD
jgi:hypothetical protein